MAKLCQALCCCVCGFVLMAAAGLGAAALIVQCAYIWQYDIEEMAYMPGNYQRIKVQSAIIDALKTNNWDAVEQGLTENNFALIISDRSGVRWEVSRGWISADAKYAIASQSKVIAALAIYRLMQRNSTLLTPNTSAAQYIPSWPKPPAEGSAVMLRDLLAFTTGFGRLKFGQPGCARESRTTQPSWEACTEEISKYEFAYPPGTTLQYGPWHLVIAAAMAMRAFGRDLTTEAWVRTVKEEVFVPSGLHEDPDYAGAESWLGPEDSGNRFPDFSGGLVMSGRQWERIAHKLHWGSLLEPAWFEEFTKDHNRHVRRIVGMLGKEPKSVLGMWHYAQGEWIACDAAAEQEVVGIQQENKICGPEPQPRVLHSVGAFGFYVWMDLTNDYNGIFIHSWPEDLVICSIISVVTVSILSLLCGGMCGCVVYRRKGADRSFLALNSESDGPSHDDEDPRFAEFNNPE
mmetsp:Transcript_24932/g.79159  ORF Transcript_24932/g.79159 Transcript_24932/m.79159 type:complete len:460 (-) Transcript_24932:9-1388(-)